MPSKAWRQNAKVSIQQAPDFFREEIMLLMHISHKIMVHVFFLTKYISISTGCKGMGRQNAFMIVQSGDRALLDMHQLLLDLMEL